MTLSAFSAAWFSLSLYKLRCDVRRELSATRNLTAYNTVHTHAANVYNTDEFSCGLSRFMFYMRREGYMN